MENLCDDFCNKRDEFQNICLQDNFKKIKIFLRDLKKSLEKINKEDESGYYNMFNAIEEYVKHGKKVSNLKWIYNKYKIDFENYNGILLKVAIEYYKVDFAKYIWTIHPNKELILNDTYFSYVFNRQLTNRRVSNKVESFDLLDFLISIDKSLLNDINENDISSTRFSILNYIKRYLPNLHEDLDIVHILKKSFDPNYPDNLEKFKLIYNYYVDGKFELTDIDIEQIFNISLESDDNLEITKFIYEKLGHRYHSFIDQNNFCKPLLIACKYKNFKSVKWILNIQPEINLKDNLQCFKEACKSDSLEILEYLYSIDKQILNGNVPFITACEYGKTEVLKWILNLTPNLDVTESNNKAFNLACFDDYSLEVSKLIYELAPDMNLLESNYECFLNACENIQEETIKWLVNIKGDEIPIDIINRGFSKIMSNYDECITLEYFLYSKYPNIDLSYDNESPLLNAVKSGDTWKIKWLLEKKPDINISINNNEALKIAINRFDYFMVDFLFKQNLNLDNFNFDSEFIKVCESKSLKLVKLFLDLKPDINISLENDKAFYNACINNSIDIAKHLLSIKSDIDISHNNFKIFHDVCRYGLINMAKWLLEINPNIDISSNNDAALRLSFSNHHLTVVKWLFEIKPDVDLTSMNDFIFRSLQDKTKRVYSCYKTLDYLCSLRPDRYKRMQRRRYEINVTYEKIEFSGKINTCPICYTNKCDIITSCNHQFCKSCIKNYNGINCPYCRNDKFKYYEII